MKFTSLNSMYENYIQSFSQLTRLNLTANEIKLIELVLSYTRRGNAFYMNHTQIAEHLVLRDTVNKAKTVGNIIRKLKKKGYFTTIQKHNFNGKNGGSSTTIKVDEVFLEQMLIAVFNANENNQGILPEPIEEVQQVNLISNQGFEDDSELLIQPKTTPVKTQTPKEFIEELEAMEEEGEQYYYDLPFLAPYNASIEKEPEQEKTEEYGYMEIEKLEDFKSMLQTLKRKRSLANKISVLDYLIDNQKNYNLDDMKSAFKVLVLDISE